MTCEKAQEFLGKRRVEAAEIRDARKSPIGRAEALQLARSAGRIVSAKGKKVVSLDLAKDRPDAAAIEALLIGPTGNLRAPTLRIGRTLLIGFDEKTYLDCLG